MARGSRSDGQTADFWRATDRYRTGSDTPARMRRRESGSVRFRPTPETLLIATTLAVCCTTTAAAAAADDDDDDVVNRH